MNFSVPCLHAGFCIVMILPDFTAKNWTPKKNIKSKVENFYHSLISYYYQ